MSTLRKANLALVVGICMSLASWINLPAKSSTLTTLHSFTKLTAPFPSGTNTDGAYPYAGLVQASDGTLYGVATYGGTYGAGTVFTITTSGSFTTLYDMTVSGGDEPRGTLVQDSAGNSWGTSFAGGAYEVGTVFSITPSGVLTIRYSFVGGTNGASDGDAPRAGLVLASDGNYYGTTYLGGGTNGQGEVFKITPAGAYTVLHTFTGSPDGGYPYGALIQNTDGNLYGTTYGGGAHGQGTVYKITLATGALTILHSFSGPDGVQPIGKLVNNLSGVLFGTTSGGGTYSDGTVFKITTAGSLTTLHSFNGTDGYYPRAGLVRASSGVYYGTTSGLGVTNGTIFKISGSGTFTNLFTFSDTDGEDPEAEMIQGSDGFFYGTTYSGGANDTGTIFKFSG